LTKGQSSDQKMHQALKSLMETNSYGSTFLWTGYQSTL